MFEEIFKNINSIKEIGFEYYNIQENYDVSINFIQQGTKVPSHAHDQEVFNYVFNGEFSIIIDDIEKTYLTGEWVNIPVGKIHSVETKTDVILLELWKK
jgi:quercetin dioxygenase-like cupin family protein